MASYEDDYEPQVDVEAGRVPEGDIAPSRPSYVGLPEVVNGRPPVQYVGMPEIVNGRPPVQGGPEIINGPTQNWPGPQGMPQGLQGFADDDGMRVAMRPGFYQAGSPQARIMMMREAARAQAQQQIAIFGAQEQMRMQRITNAVAAVRDNPHLPDDVRQELMLGLQSDYGNLRVMQSQAQRQQMEQETQVLRARRISMERIEREAQQFRQRTLETGQRRADLENEEIEIRNLLQILGLENEDQPGAGTGRRGTGGGAAGGGATGQDAAFNRAQAVMRLLQQQQRAAGTAPAEQNPAQLAEQLDALTRHFREEDQANAPRAPAWTQQNDEQRAQWMQQLQQPGISNVRRAELQFRINRANQRERGHLLQNFDETIRRVAPVYNQQSGLGFEENGPTRRALNQLRALIHSTPQSELMNAMPEIQGLIAQLPNDESQGYVRNFITAALPFTQAQRTELQRRLAAQQAIRRQQQSQQPMPTPQQNAPAPTQAAAQLPDDQRLLLELRNFDLDLQQAVPTRGFWESLGTSRGAPGRGPTFREMLNPSVTAQTVQATAAQRQAVARAQEIIRGASGSVDPNQRRELEALIPTINNVRLQTALRAFLNRYSS